MASTDYLRTINARMKADCEEAQRVTRELIRDKVLLPQSLTDYTQIRQYLMWAEHNIIQAEMAEEKAARAKLPPAAGIDPSKLPQVTDQGDLNSGAANAVAASVQIQQGQPAEPQFTYYQEKPSKP